MLQFSKTFIKIVIPLLLLAAISCSAESAVDPTTTHQSDALINRLIKLVDPLDDPGHYCIYVPGFGTNVQVDSALQAHTCKLTDNVDEQFTYQSDTKRLRMDQYQRCVEAARAEAGAQLFVRECTDDPLQRFENLEGGAIRLITDDAPDTLCIGVGDADGIRINSIHIRRVLELRSCGDSDPSQISWTYFQGASQPE